MARFIRKAVRFVLLLSLIAFALLMIFRIRYHDAILELAKTQVRNSTSDLINDAIDKQIETGNIRYERIVYFEKDLNGRITALKTNMTEVNRLKTSILNIINDEILALDTSDIAIPFGSLVFPEFFSGRGPGIPVQILSIRNSDGSFTSHFSEAGINQTLQQLTMDVSVDVSVLVLGKAESFVVNSQVVIAETIIVGQVPETFFQIGGEHGTNKENP